MEQKRFELTSDYTPTGDQPQAIESLVSHLDRGVSDQVLLGVTGSGKTFTVANMIERVQRPTLVISHNKTLAAQLYQELKEFFPNNAVSYFVSYYDYYQPEAYVPSTDTYIEKETEINEQIDKLRLAATANLLTRPDTIIVASVSCIYNIGSPREYGHFVLELSRGMKVGRESIITRLVQLQYVRNDWELSRSTFRVRGETIDLYPAYEDTVIRMTVTDNAVSDLRIIDQTTGKTVDTRETVVIYPAKHYMTDPKEHLAVFKQIEADMEAQAKRFTEGKKFIEAQRIRERVTHDLDMIREIGYVNGIENYSRYFDGRKPGDPPYTLMDYFEEATAHSKKPKDQRWLLVIDESHMTVPQVRGMYNGDRARKQTLIDYGFRLPAAIDNRPLTFDEFLRNKPQTVYVSATPEQWELSVSGNVAEQLVRPTGLLDPLVDIRPTEGQVQDLEREIVTRVEARERVLVTTLTKQMAEDLAKYLTENGVRVRYLHSDVETLKRTETLRDLRKGSFDVVIGVNLLREGLDLPEVSLVAILDADKEGFLRSRTSLIQTMGRAARHVRGKVILYADRHTDAIKHAVGEVKRRRAAQEAYNAAHGIVPATIVKPIRDNLVESLAAEDASAVPVNDILGMKQTDLDTLTPLDKAKLVKRMTVEMRKAAANLQFELAAEIRDLVATLKT